MEKLLLASSLVLFLSSCPREKCNDLALELQDVCLDVCEDDGVRCATPCPDNGCVASCETRMLDCFDRCTEDALEDIDECNP